MSRARTRGGARRTRPAPRDPLQKRAREGGRNTCVRRHHLGAGQCRTPRQRTSIPSSLDRSSSRLRLGWVVGAGTATASTSGRPRPSGNCVPRSAESEDVNEDLVEPKSPEAEDVRAPCDMLTCYAQSDNEMVLRQTYKLGCPAGGKGSTQRVVGEVSLNKSLHPVNNPKQRRSSGVVKMLGGRKVSAVGTS